MTLLEQLAKVQATKSLKQTEIKSLLTGSIGADETPNDEVEDKIKSLEAEVETLEKNHSRISKLIADEKQTENLEPIKDSKTMNQSVTVNDNMDKGVGFAKFVRAKMQSAHLAKSGDNVSAYDIAKSRNEPEAVLNLIKAGTVGTTTDAGFAAALVQPNNLQNEFIELLRANTVFDKLSSLMTNVPFNSRIASQATGSSSEWVGEGAEKPVTNPTFDSVEIKEHKLASIVIITDELLRNASPSVDKLILSDLVAATAAKIDSTFLDSVVADAVRPEGLLHGVTAVTATGRDAAGYSADLAKLKAQFIGNNLSLAGVYYVMSEVQASELAELRDVMGNTYFTGMNAGYNQKTLGGIPVLETQTADKKIILVKPSEILLADDGGVQVAYSDQATIKNGAATVNLWQENKLAIRVERYISWAKRRAVASSYIQYV